MKKFLNYIDNLNLKQLWLWSFGLICLYMLSSVPLLFTVSKLNLGNLGLNIVSAIINVLFFIVCGITGLLLPIRHIEHFNANKNLIITISIISFIFSYFYPIIIFLPLILLSVSNSDKKVGKLKWTLSILAVLFASAFTIITIIPTIMMSDSLGFYHGIEQIVLILLLAFWLIILLCFPMITLFATILGNKISWKFYLMPLILPIWITLTFVVSSLVTHK